MFVAWRLTTASGMAISAKEHGRPDRPSCEMRHCYGNVAFHYGRRSSAEFQGACASSTRCRRAALAYPSHVISSIQPTDQHSQHSSSQACNTNIHIEEFRGWKNTTSTNRYSRLLRSIGNRPPWRPDRPKVVEADAVAVLVGLEVPALAVSRSDLGREAPRDPSCEC